MTLYNIILAVLTVALGVLGCCRLALRQTSRRWIWLGMAILLVIGGALDLRFQYHESQESHRMLRPPRATHQSPLSQSHHCNCVKPCWPS